MNILILSDKYPPNVGGLAVSTRRLAQGLLRAGHSVCVSVLAASAQPGGIVQSDDEGVLVFQVGAHRRADDALSGWFDSIFSLHDTHHFDVIHAMYITQTAFVAVAAARYLGVPSVISARGNDLDRTAFDPAKFSQIVWALEHASAVTAVTTDLLRKAQAFAPNAAVRFVPNSVDTELFAPGVRDDELAKSLGLGDAPVLAFVGEARHKKGLTVLLPAFAQLCAQSAQKPTLLLIGGVRKDDAPVLRVFQKQNPTLDIRIVPNVAHEQLPVYYRLVDVLLLPSLREGMPNALLEGMACEKAVIASRVGGIVDVVQGGENGLLVPPGDVDALAQAMLHLLADPDFCARLGQAARAAVKEGFTPAREIERNLEIYRRVLRDSSSRSEAEEDA